MLDLENPPSPAEKTALLDDLDRVFTALQAHSYIGDYLLAEATLDRRAETIMKLEEDLLGFPTYPAPRVAHVAAGEPVDATMGWFNCIWQGDACARAIQCLGHTASPASRLNITGPEKLSIREVAHDFGRRFGREARVVGQEAPTAWLADASRSIALFGPPTISVDQMMDLIVDHLSAGGRLLGKPTHFEARSGKF